MNLTRFFTQKRFFFYIQIGLILFSLLFLPNKTLAGSKTVLYGGDVLENADNSYMVPVLIKNNTGIMGYKINLKYNEKDLSIKAVTAGKDYLNGTFDDNIGMKKGTCDILWSGSKSVKKDGALFYIKFTKEKGFKKKSTIKMSYSKADTFNEKYKELQIDCKNIEITSLDKLLANTDVKFENTEVKESVNDVLAHNDAAKIVKTIDEVKKPSKHSEDEHQDLATIDDDSTTQNVLAKLIEEGVDVSKIQTLDNDKQIEAVKKLYKEAKKRQNDNKIETPEHKNNKLPFIIGGCIVGCLVIAIAVGLFVRRGKKDKKDNE